MTVLPELKKNPLEKGWVDSEYEEIYLNYRSGFQYQPLSSLRVGLNFPSSFLSIGFPIGWLLIVLAVKEDFNYTRTLCDLLTQNE
jgi:hypothetical protein